MFLKFSVIRKCVQTSFVKLYIARTKETMKPIFHDISQALPTRKSQLKTKYGLENESTPLLDLSFDVYRYTCIYMTLLFSMINLFLYFYMYVTEVRQ